MLRVALTLVMRAPNLGSTPILVRLQAVPTAIFQGTPGG